MNFAALESRVPPWAPVATPLLLFETRSKQNADRKRIEREGMPVGFYIFRPYGGGRKIGDVSASNRESNEADNHRHRARSRSDVVLH